MKRLRWTSRFLFCSLLLTPVFADSVDCRDYFAGGMIKGRVSHPLPALCPKTYGDHTCFDIAGVRWHFIREPSKDPNDPDQCTLRAIDFEVDAF